MNQKLKAIGLFAILPLVMIALSPDVIPEADAKKSEGSNGTISPKSYGSVTSKIVCGDRLCNEEPEGNIGKAR